MTSLSPPSRWRSFFGRRSRRSFRAPVVPLAIFGLVVLCAVFADVIAPYGPKHMALSERLLPPFWLERGSAAHLLGTDRLGRDIFSRTIYSAQISLAAGALAVTIGATIGTLIGLVSGYAGRLVDAVLMRLTDAMISMPIILIALVFAVTLGPSFENLIVILGLVMWTRFARVARGETLTWKERDFVALARVAGASPMRILLRHILPNIANSVIVMVSLQFGWVITVEAGLSFLGAGVPPPTPSWGSMIADGRSYITTAWWISLFPGLMLTLTVISVNLLGDWLRDTLDPTTARRT